MLHQLPRYDLCFLIGVKPQYNQILVIETGFYPLAQLISFSTKAASGVGRILCQEMVIEPKKKGG